MLKLYSVIVRPLLRHSLGERLDLHDSVHTLQGIDQGHLRFSRISDLCKCNRDKRCDDDVIHDVQNRSIVYAILCYHKSRNHNKRKDGINTGHKPRHRKPEHQRILCRPVPEAVNTILKPLKGMNRLTEGLNYRNTPDIFRRFTAHGLKSILVFLHLLLHPFSHHGHHA